MSAPHIPPPAPPGGHNGNMNGERSGTLPSQHRVYPPQQRGSSHTLPHGSSLASSTASYDPEMDAAVVPPSKSDKKRHSVLAFLKKKK